MEGWQSHRAPDRRINCSECAMLTSSRASVPSTGVMSTGRTSECQVDLLLQGTPAPRCDRKPFRPKYRPRPPPNSPSLSSAMPPLLPLPIDRIMVLQQRLDLSAAPDFDQQQFYTSHSRSAQFSATARLSCCPTSYEKSDSNSQLVRPCQRINSRLSFSDRASSTTSSQRDLSIDLTSLNSDHESDSSHDSDSKYRSTTKSSRRAQNFSSPLFVPSNKNGGQQYSCKTSSYFSSETSSDTSKLVQRRRLSMSPTDNKSWSSLYPGSSQQSSSRTSNAHSRRSSDLICVYVDTVSNTHLAKYLRPCISCHEPCCVCPPETTRSLDKSSPDLPENDKIFSNGNESTEKSLANTTGEKVGAFNCKHQEAVAIKEPSSTKLLCNDVTSKMIDPEDQEAINVFNKLQVISEKSDERRDSGNCTLDDNSHSGILSRRHVSLSLMQLSTAAQCARILADSLEGVLQLAKEEVSSLAESPARSDFDSTPDSLQSALETLKNTYSKDKFEPLLSGFLDNSFDSKAEGKEELLSSGKIDSVGLLEGSRPAEDGDNIIDLRNVNDCETDLQNC